MGENLLIFGPPGSGKGTQAAILGERREIAHISTGDMLRAAMAAGSELGKKVQGVVEHGDLVPDALMIELVSERLRESDALNGFILDGFPRTVTQAEGLLSALKKENRSIKCLIQMDVPDELLIERALGRGRSDDTRETIGHRLEVYRNQTQPVLNYLVDKVREEKIYGVGDISEITERIESAVGAKN